jgi:hypothetical protein
LIIVLLLISASHVIAQDRMGSITGLEGESTLERAGHQSPVAVATELRSGDRLRTGLHSHLNITLLDGSQLTLFEDSSMVLGGIPSTHRTSFTNLLKGRLRSLIKWSPSSLSASSVFEVHTPNAIAGVRGTDFETAYIEGRPCPGFPDCLRYTDVGVYKGVVEVSNPTSKTAAAVTVTEGHETKVPCELPPTASAPLGLGEIGGPSYH